VRLRETLILESIPFASYFQDTRAGFATRIETVGILAHKGFASPPLFQSNAVCLLLIGGDPFHPLQIRLRNPDTLLGE
jgi:hypothetical protein